MGMKKFGTGQILPDEEDSQKTASQEQTWDKDDEKDLATEDKEG